MRKYCHTIIQSIVVFALLLCGTQVQAATVQLPKTGQTTCYDSAGATVPCAGTGQDGELQQGKTWPVSRFIVNGDTTISDMLSGLNWAAEANTPGPLACTPGATKNWTSALAHVACLNSNSYLGFSDWRLPNINELASLLNYEQSNIAVWLNTQGFTNVQQNNYWSSTLEPNNSSGYPVWFVSMSAGGLNLDSRNALKYVLPVRGFADGSGTISLPKTGNTICINPSSTNTIIPCSGTGQDGEYQFGVAWPSPRFTNHGNGTITDEMSGLMWSQDSKGHHAVCTLNPYDNYQWQESLDFIKCLNTNNYQGHSDWRLPAVTELEGLKSYGVADNSTWLSNQTFGVPYGGATYWTADTYAQTPNIAWNVSAGGPYAPTGITTKIGNYNYAWPVRSPAVTGVCGSSNNASVGSAPVTGLCASGVPGMVIAGTGIWNWNCLGVYGGVDAACSATLDSIAPQDGTLNAVAGNNEIVLSWNGFSDAGSGISSYKLAMSSQAAVADCSTGIDVGLATSYTHANIVNGMPYYYRVCAVDAVGLISSGATASATPAKINLTITNVGSGTVKSQVAGIDCGATCSASMDRVVTLLAQPSAGNYFSGWTGDCVSSALACNVIMDTAKTVTATFTATPPAVLTWNKTVTATGEDHGRAVRQTADGGSIVAGSKSLVGATESAVWVVKNSPGGTVEWQKTYSNGTNAGANDIQQTADGGYIVAGYSYNGVTSNDAWIIKLAADGTVEWQNNYGTNGVDSAASIQQTTDGGYVFTGTVDNFGYSNLWVVKLDSAGAVLWENKYGTGSGLHKGTSIQQTSDGGYIVAGQYDASMYVFTPWVLKLAADGSITWQERFVASATPVDGLFASIKQTSDGGYIAGGKNGIDAWLVKLGASGDISWQYTFNYLGTQGAATIVEATDGSFTAATSGALINVSADGSTLNWQNNYAFTNSDVLGSVIPAADGGFLAVGTSGAYAESEVWQLKVSPTGAVNGWMQGMTSSYSTTGGGVTATVTSVTPTATASTKTPTTATPQAFVTLTTVKTGSGFGLVASAETPRPKIDCGNVCSAVYPLNTTVNLTATPFSSSTFDGWSDAGCSTGTCSVTLAADTTISATFANHGEVKVFDETFNAGLPGDWLASAVSGPPWGTFATANNAMALNLTRGGGGYISADSNAETELLSSGIDLSTYTSATLVFKADGGNGRPATVDVSGDGGTTWVNVLRRDNNTIPTDFTLGSTTNVVDVSVVAGSSSAMLRFNFIGADGNSWNIDDVQIYGTAIPVSEAVDAPTLTWKTGGNAPWKNQGGVTKDGIDAAQSGTIIDNQISWMETSVDLVNPAALSFWWTVASELDFDFLRFYIDGVEQAAISGTLNDLGSDPLSWEQKHYVLTAGRHTLRWEYSKDETASEGADSAWVDMVELCEGSYTVSPTMLSTGFAGGAQSFTITPVSGSCLWSVTTPSWITADVGAGGGAATVNVTVAPGPELYGTISIAGKLIHVTRSGNGGVDTSFNPPENVITTTGSGGEKAALLYPSSDSSIFYKVGIEGTNYTIQRRKVSDGTPQAGLGDGTIDGANPGFNISGRIILPTLATNSAYPTKAALQSDGKIVIFGYGDTAGTAFQLLRLTVTGELDTTFGGSGTGYKNYTFFGDVSGGGLAVVPPELYLDADKIVIAVNTNTNTISRVGVVRFVADGSIEDTAFGLDGTIISDSITHLMDMNLASSGRILLVGYKSGDSTDGWLMNLNADGTVDTGFGAANGYVTFNNGNFDRFYGVAAQADGKIVVTGESYEVTSNTGFLSVLRYTDTGILDTTFAATAATPGVLLHGGADVGGLNFNDQGRAIAVQPNGKIVVGGAEWNSTINRGVPTYLRLNTDGSIDSGYGYNGSATLGSLDGSVNSFSLRPDWKIMSSGYSANSNFTLRQIAGLPGITLSTDANFPLIPVELPSGQSSVVTISNSGETTLDISSIALSGSAEFSLAFSWDHYRSCGVSNPKIEPGDYCDVLVSFDPVAVGTPSATLTVTSNAPSSPSTLVFNGNVTADVTPPSDGFNFSAGGGAGFVSLAWDTAYDLSGVTGYKLVFDTIGIPADCTGGTLLYTGTNQAFTHFDLATGLTYYYRVCAFDAAGNTSFGKTASAVAAAQTKLWTPAANGNWDDPVNWSPQGVPGPGDDVLIDTGSFTITLNSPVTINSLTFGGTGAPSLFTGTNTLTINSSARIKAGATLVNTSVVSINGNFMNDGIINGAGELFLSNVPNAMFFATSPLNIGKLTLYSSTATIPTGSLLGELRLWSVTAPFSTVTLTDNLNTANTILTIVNSNNTINGPGTITNSVSNTLDLSGVAINTAVHNAGTINVTNTSSFNSPFTNQPGSSLNVSLGMAYLTFANGFSNFGDITITPSNMNYAGYLHILNGALTNESGATFTVAPVGLGAGDTYLYGQLINAGDVTINQNTYIDKLSANHVNAGSLTIQNGATLAIANGTFFNNTGGTVQGNGTLDLTSAATFTGNAGSVTGGSTGAPDKLTILGSLPDTATASTNIGIGHPSGQINVSGSATLAGTLNVSLVDFYPSIGDKFLIMTCGTSCNGAFDALNLQSPGSSLAWKLTNAADWNGVGGGVLTTSRADHVSMATAPNGTPYIAYADQTNVLGKLTVKQFQNNAWSTVGTPEFSAGTAYYSSIAVAPDGTVYVAYQDGGAAGRLTVKAFSGSVWWDVGTNPVSINTAWYTSLKVASDGTPYLAYVDEFSSVFNVIVQKFSGGTWKQLPGGSFPADSDTTSLAFAPDGSLYLAYRGDFAQGYQTQVVRFDGANWTAIGGGAASVSGAFFNSLAIAPDGTPYVAYVDENTVSPANRATVRRFDGTSWGDVGSAGLSSGSANNISLAVTPAGVPYLAYKDIDANTLSAKMFDGLNWQAAGSAVGNADFVSLGITRDGSAYLAFSDLGNGGYATLDKLQGVVALDVVFSVSPTALLPGLFDSAYSQTVSASGGTSPYTYTILSGNLPPGLTINGSTGLISGTPTSAGSYTFTLRVTDSNGVIVDMAYPLDIAKANPIITIWPAAAVITYGQTLANATLSGAVAATAGSFIYDTPSTAPVAGTAAQSVIFVPTDNANYTTAMESVSVTVNKAVSNVTAWPTASAITYGQTLADSVLSGGVATPAGSFAFTAPSTAPNAGTATQNVIFTPTDTINYTSASGSTSVTVNQATPSVSIWPAASTLTYGQTLTNSTLSGGSATVPGIFAFTTQSTAPSAGTATQNVTFTPSDTVNYVSVNGSVSVTVIKATPVISWDTPAAISYGTPLSGSQLNAATAPAGSFSYTPPAGTILPAGNQTLSTTFTPTDTANYNSSSTSTSLTVSKTAATISLANTAQTYDGNLKTVSVTTVPAGLSHLVTYDGSAAAPSVAGSYAVAASISDPNYSGSASGTLTIGKVTPVITWAPPAAVPVGTALSATQLNATSGAIAGTFTYTPASGSIMNSVGSQTLSVTFTPTDSVNYTLQTATVNLTVTDKIIPVLTWVTPPAITYGTALDTTQLNATSGGVPGSFTYTPSAGSLLTAGTQALSVTFTPTDTVTYSSTSAIVNLTVNKAIATVNLGSLNLSYDGTLRTISATTVPAGLSYLVTYDGSIAAPINAGSYAVIASVSDLNYIGSATGTMTVAKATPVISWANPAAITYGTPLSATQLNASVTGIAGTYAYNPVSGVLLSVGTAQSLSVTFTPADSVNYSEVTKTVTIDVAAAPVDQVSTGSDGKTTVDATITTSDSSIAIKAGTLLTDGNGNPISGTLTVAAQVLNSTAQLPGGLLAARSADGKSLVSFGNSIDITITAGSSVVKTISPPMIVTLSVPAAFAAPGATVAYYSNNGSTWTQEGTAVVKPDGTIDMSVSHLSVWAVAAFAADSIPPTVATVDLPTTTPVKTVPVNNISATDNVTVTGYLLKEDPLPPPATAPGWSATIPADFTCKTWGNNVIYTFAKDSADNVSAPISKVVFVGLDPVTDGVVVPATDKLEPGLADALQSMKFAMKELTPNSAELQHGRVSPLVNGIPQPDASRTELNLGDTIIILRRVVGL